MSRRKGRILAFQGLYSWDVGKSPKEDVLKLDWAKEKALDEEGAAFARLLISGTIDNSSVVDELITKNLSGWEFKRVNKVTIAILRMSVYSLLFQKDIPAKIVIDEAVDIAKEFGPDDSYKFVNAVLDKINKTAEKEENSN